MTRYYANCPKCRKTYHQAAGKAPIFYGDPHTACPACGAEFLDTWTFELGLYPRRWYVTHHRRVWVYLAITAVMILAYAALFHFGAEFMESSHGGIAVLAIFVLWLAAIGVYRAKTTRISVSDTGFDRQYEESAKRLSDPMYKHKLIDSGYYKSAIKHIRQ